MAPRNKRSHGTRKLNWGGSALVPPSWRTFSDRGPMMLPPCHGLTLSQRPCPHERDDRAASMIRRCPVCPVHARTVPDHATTVPPTVPCPGSPNAAPMLRPVPDYARTLHPCGVRANRAASMPRLCGDRAASMARPCPTVPRPWRDGPDRAVTVPRPWRASTVPGPWCDRAASMAQPCHDPAASMARPG